MHPSPTTTATGLDLPALVDGHACADVVAMVPPGHRRRWTLLHRDDDHEAWAIAWPVGSSLELHDHDGSAAAVRVVRGHLRERYVGPDGDLVMRWLTPDGVVELPSDHTHEMANVGDVEAVSVHVYSPPQRQVRPGAHDGPDPTW